MLKTDVFVWLTVNWTGGSNEPGGGEWSWLEVEIS